ncbi:hypothetical protein [Diaphorobacter caeni]|uniref:hypothetical protein n=1 Tax=Diaphorobacter caeni TaxID=2784387 RepID=UPI00188E1AAE|nr:hypothetical protein [Diaphorobacter caeni]MBF5007636.1 hypothetical protein [Diaphorobacter caeni]
MSRKTNAHPTAIFSMLLALPPSDEFWRNTWMFTKPVFMNASRQGRDATQFLAAFENYPLPLQRYITRRASQSKEPS